MRDSFFVSDLEKIENEDKRKIDALQKELEALREITEDQNRHIDRLLFCMKEERVKLGKAEEYITSIETDKSGFCIRDASSKLDKAIRCLRFYGNDDNPRFVGRRARECLKELGEE